VTVWTLSMVDDVAQPPTAVLLKNGQAVWSGQFGTYAELFVAVAPITGASLQLVADLIAPAPLTWWEQLRVRLAPSAG
jgi:hypothetical protein